MKSLKLASIAVSALLLSSAASAADMYIDLGTNSYDAARVGGAFDANTTTGIFDLFGFTDLFATSIYDYSDGSLFGAFYDTNNVTTLSGLGLPTSGLSLDGSATVTLDLPDCAAGQCDVDALSPLAPPVNFTDSEGFLSLWDFQLEYTLFGTLTPGGPVYTGGTIDVFFNEIFSNANDRKVLTLSLTGSNIQLANLDLFFDITFAEAGFLWIDNGSGSFLDAAAGIPTGNYARVQLDTNVVPPIPTGDQLLLVGTDAIRQSSLDGSFTASIPEPASLSILGLGLLGLVAAGRRQRKQAK